MTPATHKAIVDQLTRAGYQVHFGGEDAGELFNRYWWTLSRPGWMECTVCRGYFDTEDEAIADAVRAMADEALKGDRLYRACAALVHRIDDPLTVSVFREEDMAHRVTVARQAVEAWEAMS